jgi:hypothetical protein
LRASRAHRLGIIDDITRDNAVDTLENAIFFNNDLSFVDSDDILSLIPPTKIMRLTVRMRRELLGELSDKVSAICDEPDLDIDPEDNYQEFNSYLYSLRLFFDDDPDACDTISNIEGEVEGAIDEIRRKKVERERARGRQSLRDEDEEWSDRASDGLPPNHSVRLPLADQLDEKPRSVFSDVDE